MIEAKQLRKEYGDLVAVNNVSFKVNQGEILAFLGPNGAGKSTTMRMLTGFVTPTSGTAEIIGKDILQTPLEAKKLIGYLPESAPNYKDLKVREFLGFIAGIHGIANEDLNKKVDEVMEKTFLSAMSERLIDNLSKGYRQRVSFAQALIHDPPVLILDEPTDGLDPNQKNEVRHLIRKISADKAIILSTHILEEMEAVCDRAMIINNGEIVIDSNPEELTKRSKAHNAIKFTLSESSPAILEKLENISNVLEVKTENEKKDVEIFPKGGADISSSILHLLNEEKIIPESFSIEKGRMDEVFANLTTTQN